jgi:arylesterase/paraoxonase
VPHLYDRYVGIYDLLVNGPDKIEPIYTFKHHEIKFADQIRNCEDVILEEELGIAFLSCDPGRDRWNSVMVLFFSQVCVEKITTD